jgi:glycerol-3-phosphate acyltransferase PlsX
MGGECPPDQLLKAVCRLAKKQETHTFFVFCEEFCKAPLNVIHIPVQSFVSLEEDPFFTLKREDSFSMKEGLLFLKEKKIDLFVTLGNTGALMALSKKLLPLLPQVIVPTLLAILNEGLVVNDVGGNVRATHALLEQNAFLGALFHSEYFGTPSPRVALLNMGEESLKGPKEFVEAFRALRSLQNPPFTFVGNIEPQEIWEKKIDVLVTDGFSGNLLIKTIEGMVSYFNVDYSLEKRLAFVAGIEGLVIKLHSYTNEKGLEKALESHLSSNLSSKLMKKGIKLLNPT